MNPLSIFTYYLNNKRKVGPVTGIVMLSILAISSAGALTGSLFEDVEREFALYDYYAAVYSRRVSGLSDAMLDKLQNHLTVARAVEMTNPATRTQGIFGESHTHIYFLPAPEQQAFATRVGWYLMEGRWPEPDTNEVAVTQNVLRNRGLQVGDRIGEDVDEKDSLRGDWLIVGAFPATEVTGGIGDLDYARGLFSDPDLPTDLADRPHSLVLVSVEGKETEMEAFLDSLPSEEVNVWHRSRADRELDEDLANVNMIIWVLNAVSIIVISLAVGLLNVIFFMQRANEFGLLAAVGYTKRFLARRTFLEAAVTVAFGWALGILFSEGIYSVVSALLFVPKGLSALTILTPRILLFTTPVPITVTVFSVAIVMWQLWRMDPVAIIERRD